MCMATTVEVAGKCNNLQVNGTSYRKQLTGMQSWVNNVQSPL